ncbi:MAG: hypothetical protein ACK5SQ_02590 [Chitinophagales bacterium]
MSCPFCLQSWLNKKILFAEMAI